MAGKTGVADAKSETDEAIRAAVEYAPIFALGNICIGESSYVHHGILSLKSYFTAGWLVFWLRESFWISQAFVTVNTTAHLIAVSRLPPLTQNSPKLLWATHFVAKSIAGIGVLDFIDNGGVATVSLLLRY